MKKLTKEQALEKIEQLKKAGYHIIKGGFHCAGFWYKYMVIRNEKDGSTAPVYFNLRHQLLEELKK